MLVLTVKEGESIYIGDNTTVTLIEKWTDEVALRVDTNEILTIDDTGNDFIQPYPEASP